MAEVRQRNVAVVVSILAALIALAALVLAGIALAKTSAIAQPGASASAVPSATSSIGVPRIVSEKELRAFGVKNGPIYWAGTQSNMQYELTQTANGSVFIRYLPAGASAGDVQRNFLSVATYPIVDGYAQLVQASTAKNATADETQSGALVVTYSSASNSTYFSFPASNFQVEVFSPAAGESKKLVDAGTIEVLK
jgi:hypothetical protein